MNIFLVLSYTEWYFCAEGGRTPDPNTGEELPWENMVGKGERRRGFKLKFPQRWRMERDAYGYHRISPSENDDGKEIVKRKDILRVRIESKFKTHKIKSKKSYKTHFSKLKRFGRGRYKHLKILDTSSYLGLTSECQIPLLPKLTVESLFFSQSDPTYGSTIIGNKNKRVKTKKQTEDEGFDVGKVLKKIKKAQKNHPRINRDLLLTAKHLEPLGSFSPGRFFYMLNDHFSCHDILGSGSYSTAYWYKSRKDSQVDFAFIQEQSPQLDHDGLFINRDQDEVSSILSNSPHLNIMFVFLFLRLPHSCVTIAEHIVGSSLHSLLEECHKLWSDGLKKVIILQILAGLEHLHKHNIIHLDLHLSNIMIDKNYVAKIIDLGMARILPNGSKICMKRPFFYVHSPELIMGRPVGWDADMWSLGVIIYIFFEEKGPFDKRGVMRYIRDGIPQLLEFKSTDKDFKNLMKRMLCFNPKRRLGMEKTCHGQIRCHIFFDSTLEKA